MTVSINNLFAKLFSPLELIRCYFNQEFHTDEFKNKIYGFCLILSHLYGWAWIFYRKDYQLPIHFQKSVCWPLFSNCSAFFENNSQYVLPTAILFSVLTLILAIFIWHPRVKTTKSRLFVLLALLMHLIFLSFDFRMKMNQHLMHFALDIGYLISSRPQMALRLLIVAFYFFAGLLKFDPDWLSGLALYRQPWFVPNQMISIATRYVILLEVVFIWTLLFKNRRWRWFTLIQLMVFHISSFPVVNFYYPLLMLTLLSLFLIYDAEYSIQGFQINRRQSIWPIIFIALQFFPRLLTQHPALTSQGRSLALHMFDSSVKCQAQIFYTLDSQKKLVKLDGHYTTRLRCDPIIFWFQVKNFCRFQFRLEMLDVEAILQSRRSSTPNYSPIVHFKNICRSELPNISLFYNSWVLEPTEESQKNL